MPDEQERVKVLRSWVQKAENDLMTAAHTLRIARKGPTDTVCFHAQQCVERYLKAILVLEGIDFPKTHVIKDVIALLPARFRPTLDETEQDTLTGYATGLRYPEVYHPISLTEARRAVAIARRVRRELRRYLPRSVTRLRRR